MEKSQELQLHLETLSALERGVIISSLKNSIEVIENFNKSRPKIQLPALKPAVFAYDEWAEKSLRELWRGPEPLSVFNTLSRLLGLPQGQKFSGFHIKGRDWLIHEGETEDNNRRFLTEKELKDIYIKLGGDINEANSLFPEPSISQ